MRFCGLFSLCLFSRVTFLVFYSVEVQVAQALVDFRDGVPAGAVFKDAPLLHEEVDEVFLLAPDLPEVVEVLPNVDVEVVLDAVEQGPLPRFGDVVVIPWVVGLAVWDLNGDFPFQSPGRDGVGGQGYGGSLQHLALDGATAQGHGVAAAMPVDEPLAEVGWHFQVDAVFGHGF